MKHKSILQSLRFLTLLGLMVLGIGNAWGGTDVTFEPASDKSFPKDGITLSVSSGTLTNGTDYRVYKSATMTISSTVGNITNVALTYSNSYDGGGWASSYQPNATSWTSPTANGEQARITKIVVTVASLDKLNTPTGLNSGTPTTTGTTLSWDAVSNAGSYKVEYKVSSASQWTAVSPIPTTTTCNLTGLTPETTYAWQVTAIPTNTSQYSNSEAASGTNFTTAALQSYSVTWYVNGQTYTEGGPTTSVKEGSKVTTLPTEPTISGKTFMGWTTSPIDGTQASAPSPLFKTAGNAPEVSSVTNYYAVFATATAGGTKWTKTAASAVTAGTYAIITTDGHAFNGSISSGHGQVTSTAFSFTDNVATSAPEGTLEITIAASGSGYTMYNADKGYLYASAASSGQLAWHSTETSYWSYASSNWKYNSNSAYLRSYNNNSIRTYSTNNGDVLQFAKKESATTYSDYCTSVKTLESIAVSGTPTKTEYQAGEAFDPAGLTVTGTYDDESQETITEGITWTFNPETLSAGTTSCTVTAKVGSVTSPAYTVNGLTVTEPLPTAEAPTMDIEAGTYYGSQTVTLTSTTEGATFLYSLDGSTPFIATTGTVTVPSENTVVTKTLRAITVKDGYNNSSMTSRTYTLNPSYSSLEDLVKYCTPTTAGFNVQVSFSNAVIQGFYTNKNSERIGVKLYVNNGNSDETIEIYKSVVSSEWQVGGKLSATNLRCPWKLYSGTKELCPESWDSLEYTAPIPQLDTPTELSVSTITNESATLSWTAVTDAASYKIEYRTGEDAWSSVSTTETTIGITGLSANTEYQWKVTAISGDASTHKDSEAAAGTNFTTAPNAPTLDTPAGDYQSAFVVKVSDYDDDFMYFYTTDGTAPGCNEELEPTGTSLIYNHTTGISITSGCTLKIVASNINASISSVTEAVYTITVTKVATPTISIVAGTYDNVQSVSLVCETADANIYYTLDGVDPTDASTQYSGTPISITQSCTLKAIAYKEGLTASDIVSSTYVLKAKAATFSVAEGKYYAPQSVAISSETTGDDVVIRYAFNDEEITETSAVYSEPVAIDASKTLKAQVFKTGWTASDVTAAVYELQAVTPTFSVEGGTYTETQSVELSTTTDEATIRYTIDGTEPTSTSAEYSSAIEVSSTTTIKAKAFKDGWTSSETGSATYTIKEASVITLMDKGDNYAVVNTYVGEGVLAAIAAASIDAPTSRTEMSDFVFKGWAQNKDINDPQIVTDAITATASMTLYAIYGKTDAEKTSWNLVTNASQLTTDSKVVIAAKDAKDEKFYAMSTTQNSGNRGQAEITKIAKDNTITLTDNVAQFTLAAGTVDNTFAFNTGSGYLYAASSKSNELKTQGTNNENGSWKITISDNVASIVAQGTNSRNTMQYNSTSSLFSCYGSASQGALELYKKTTTPGTTTYDFEETSKIYSVTYNAHGGTGDVPTCSTLYATEDTHIVLGAGDLSKEGHTFAYWTTTEDGTGTHYAAGDEYTFGEASVTFYAQWSPISYTVTLNTVEDATVTASYGDSQVINEGGSADVPYGTEVTLTAIGIDGKQIAWDVDGATVSAETGSPVTFTVGTADVTIDASVHTVRQFTLVTSNAGLVPGAQYILVSTTTNDESYVANGTMGSEKYMASVAVPAPIDNSINIIGQAINPIVLGKNGDDWYLNSIEGQYGAKAAKTMLLNEATEWSIEIDESTHVASITNDGGTIKYNRTSPRFLNYASGQADIYLYKLNETSSTGTFSTTASSVYTTFYTEDEFLMPEGAQGGVVRTKEESTVVVSYNFTPGSIVPAGTPLVIKGTANTNYTYTKTHLGAEYDGVNYLLGVPENNYTTVGPNGEETGYKFYKLSYYSSTQPIIGFYYGAENGGQFTMSKKGRAYLALEEEMAVKINGISMEDLETGIINLDATREDDNNDVIYNLGGQRINKLQKGINIVNGSKILF